MTGVQTCALPILESTAIGLVAGINASGNLLGLKYVPVPETTAHGALVRYITESGSRNFQPGNINIGLFPPLDGKIKDKKLKRKKIAERALQDWREYLDKLKDR